MRTVSPMEITALDTLPVPDMEDIRARLDEKRRALGRKVVVLDDDPTGIQTVHGVSVYTGWSEEEGLRGFEEENGMFFIMTNSRAFTGPVTRKVHQDIACRVAAAAKATGKDFILISRGDSTLRGHYPLETETLRDTLEACTDKRYCGEIVMPFFREGGRLTVDDVHYVRDGNRLIPAGQTEFAKDKTFGYAASDLRDWCEEKTGGRYPANGILSVSLEDLRALQVEKIAGQLMEVRDFNKVVVNAVSDCDVEVFALAYYLALERGHEFLFRTAAAVPKVLGGVPDRPLLSGKELRDPGNPNGGIILVGSHVQKTTLQLEELRRSSKPVEFIEFNQHLVLQPGGLREEVDRVVALAEEKLRAGRTVAVYTRRERLDLNTQNKEKQLVMSVEISDAITSIIGRLTVKPSFIVAKGGITSSDVGTKALRVKRAVAMGQIQPGVPVWMTGPESKFPGMPYVIFPGNVGAVDTLKKTVELLME